METGLYPNRIERDASIALIALIAVSLIGQINALLSPCIARDRSSMNIKPCLSIDEAMNAMTSLEIMTLTAALRMMQSMPSEISRRSFSG